MWGGREGYDTLLNTSMRRESDQLARFMTMVVEHKAKIGFDGHAAHRTEASGTHQASVRLRHRHGPGVPQPLRARRRVQGEHRGQPRHARPATRSTTKWRTRSRTVCSAASTPTAVIPRTGGTPTSSRTPWTNWRSCSTRSSGVAGSRTAGSTSTPSCAGRVSIAATCSTVTSAASTRWPERCWWPRR